MQKTLAFALCAAVGTAASAHPFGDQWSQKPVPGPVTGGVDAPIELDEDFEAYSVGEGMTTMGGWELWDDPIALDATITDLFAASGSNSADFSLTNIDVVHQFSGITSGQVTWSVNTYFPTGAAGQLYLIALNRYDQPGGTTSWSIQVQFDATSGLIMNELVGLEAAAMVYDEWVEFRAEIDLDADTIDLFYDGEEFVSDQCWTCTVQGQPAGTGSAEFAAIDLYTPMSSTGTDFYLDDIVVETDGGGCYADCDQTGSLDFFDFLCFQNAFSVQDPYADCDGTGSHDFFDFLCFQNEFAAGCP